MTTPAPGQLLRQLKDLVDFAIDVRRDYRDAYEMAYWPGRGQGGPRRGPGHGDPTLEHHEASEGMRAHVKEAARLVQDARDKIIEASAELNKVVKPGSNRSWIEPAAARGRGRPGRG